MKIRKIAETALTTANVVDSLTNTNSMDAPTIKAINKILSGFGEYLGDGSITISPTVDVYAQVEAMSSTWGYAGAEIGVKVGTPAGATQLKGFQTKTNGHDTLGVPCFATYLYLLPAGGTYTFTIAYDGTSGGSKGKYIKASTIPKLD